METTFLQAALNTRTPLRIILKHGNEIQGIIQDIEKYNIRCSVEGKSQTIPKKEIALFLSATELIQPAKPVEKKENQQGLQELILEGYRAQKRMVTVSLIGGGSRWGVINGFDPFTIILKQKDGQSLIYKHAVACLTVSGIHREKGKNSHLPPKGQAKRPEVPDAGNAPA